MLASRTSRLALVVTLAAGASACASASNAFERHDRYAAEQQAAAVDASRVVCPVVLSNATDVQLDAGYQVGGVQSVLGLIPAGRSLSFGVVCDAGSIEAFAVSEAGGLFGGGSEYRTLSAVDPSGSTRVSFTATDRVR